MEDIYSFNPEYKKDRVSIIIPSYNRFDFLLNALSSVKNQNFIDKEIIVIDDASTDKRYQSYNWEEIIYKRLDINNREKYNFGCANGITRNQGIYISTGEYLAFLDDDDYYLHNKLTYQMECMKKYGYQFSTTNMLCGHGIYHAQINKRLYFETKFGIEIDKDIYELDSSTIKDINYITLSSVILHRDIIKEYGGFGLGVAEDYKLWKKIIKKYKCLYLNLPTIYYDLNHGNGKLYSC